MAESEPCEALISTATKQVLVSRFRNDKRFNGVCLGNVICVDNLGRRFDEGSVRCQLAQLLQGVVEIRFAGVRVKGHTFHFGWCCVEFESVDAAVVGMGTLDKTYLRMGNHSSSILRPLLSHFPCWLEQPLFQMRPLNEGDTSPMALHLGQPNTVDRECREFIRLDKVLQETRNKVMEQRRRELVPLLRRIVNEETEMCEVPCKTAELSLGVLWLKNVPESVSDKRLCAFFECFEPQVSVLRLSEPVTKQMIPHSLVLFQSTEKAKLVCQDVQTQMLVTDGFRPIVASVFDPSSHEGFESVFDRALYEAGYISTTQSLAKELVLIEDVDGETATVVLEIRKAMDAMQHSRCSCKKLKLDQEKALHEYIVSEAEKMHRRFEELNKMLDAAEINRQ